MLKSGAVVAGPIHPRKRKFSVVGTVLTLGIAALIGYVVWSVVSTETPADERLPAPAASGSTAAECSYPAREWIDEDGKDRPVSDLAKIQEQHDLWVSHGRAGPGRANFRTHWPRGSGPDLSCVDLHGFRFPGADLRGAKFIGANLSGADLSGAELNLANFTGGDLSGAKFDGANLDGEDPDHATDFSRARMEKASFAKARLKYALFLEGADLRGARLGGAGLSGSDFTRAQLMGVDITETQFDDKTDLQQAVLASAVFQPAILPDAEHTYEARGLQLLTFTRGDKKALTALRQRFHTDGYDSQERQITYALQHAAELEEWNTCSPWKDDEGAWPHHRYVTVVSNCVAASLNTLIFDLPFQYGMNPNRPLYIVGALWLLCSIAYVVIIKARGRAAIYLICQRDYRDGSTVVRRIRIAPRPLQGATQVRRLQEIFLREGTLWRVALFFSLQSALNIGFEEFEFGRWLRLLTIHEYEMKAVGWARTLSGFQSLVSLLMLALSIWGLFGSPFFSS